MQAFNTVKLTRWARLCEQPPSQDTEQAGSLPPPEGNPLPREESHLL